MISPFERKLVLQVRNCQYQAYLCKVLRLLLMADLLWFIIFGLFPTYLGFEVDFDPISFWLFFVAAILAIPGYFLLQNRELAIHEQRLGWEQAIAIYNTAEGAQPNPAEEFYRQQNNLRPYGLSEGEFVVPDDFDDPLPEDILDLFEGKEDDLLDDSFEE